MKNKRQWLYDCILNWRRGKKIIPHQLTTNVPVLFTTSSLMHYRTFTTTFKAMEASFVRREKVLQYPGYQDLMDDIEPEEFVADENLNYNKEMSVDEGVTEDNKTIKTSNIPSTPTEEPPTEAFAADPSPSTLRLNKRKMRA